MAGLKPDMVAYEAMSNASAQRATCGGHRGLRWTLMAGLEPDVVTCNKMSNASAQRATCKGPQKSFSERCWLP